MISNSTRTDLLRDTEQWLTACDQSPRAPARYPKATTIKRKMCERKKQTESERSLRRQQMSIGAQTEMVQVQ